MCLCVSCLAAAFCCRVWVCVTRHRKITVCHFHRCSDRRLRFESTLYIKCKFDGKVNSTDETQFCRRRTFSYIHIPIVIWLDGEHTKNKNTFIESICSSVPSVFFPSSSSLFFLLRSCFVIKHCWYCSQVPGAHRHKRTLFKVHVTNHFTHSRLWNQKCVARMELSRIRLEAFYFRQ